MTFDPLLSAPPIVQTHVALALTALVLGPLVLWRPRRDRLHKTLGYVWVSALAGAALVSFGITSPFTSFGLSPIHLLSVYALYGIYVAMRAIWRRDIALHRHVMQNLYVRGVVLAGAFNFLPGRTTQHIVIPNMPELGYGIIAVVLVWAFWPLSRRAPRIRA
ncbi:DUF2306 domain-containing protein [uncultured Tateyamaria sp.]|uniref:DUF2306 domain-containing protein n=1 Tax=Tateyamaria sp. 1078 TaxID=3417464 RepID=UPI0026313AF4|nr:DUF2306 domain-containing protein [uncultured Tateyamaria sp.]